MKRLSVVLCVLLLLSAAGCKDDNPAGNGPGKLNIRLNVDDQITLVPTQAYQTRTNPDLSSFTLEVLQNGTSVQKLPAIGNNNTPSLTLPAGDYTVEVYSQRFTMPAFDTPVYGASQDLVIMAGATKNITMECRQTNAGVSVTYSDAFKAKHTTYSTRIEHTNGTLMFSGGDAARTGYFPAGYVNLVVTADGKDFPQSIQLKPCRLYSITVKDEDVPVISGNTNITITVTTDVEHENIEIAFPSDDGGSGTLQTLYEENMGAADVSGPTLVFSYKGWQNQSGSGISYSGGGKVDCQEGYTSNYAGASGGNYLTLTTPNAFTISGLNTTGFTSLAFSFGSSSGTALFTDSDLTLSYIDQAVDPNLETPLSYTRSNNAGWETARITSGLPETENLKIRITCGSDTYRLDDFKLTGKK